MPRSTLDEQVELGLLTAPSASLLMPMSRTTIANLGRRGLLPRITTPGIRETRFSALELLKYCGQNRLPYKPALLTAAGNYARKYGQLNIFLALLSAEEQATLANLRSAEVLAPATFSSGKEEN